MRVIVLTTGRSGSTTFIKACEHMTNYTTGHEAHRRRVGPWRYEYDDNHIEADCRLAWLLGPLDHFVGKDAFYVHLTRDPAAVAKSMIKLADLRRPSAVVQRGLDLPKELNTRGAEVWAHMHLHGLKTGSMELVAADVVDTINFNIASYLKDKDWMHFRLERAGDDFPKFWNRIGAQGDYEAALAEFDVRHNSFDDIFEQSGADVAVG